MCCLLGIKEQLQWQRKYIEFGVRNNLFVLITIAKSNVNIKYNIIIIFKILSLILYIPISGYFHLQTWTDNLKTSPFPCRNAWCSILWLTFYVVLNARTILDSLENQPGIILNQSISCTILYYSMNFDFQSSFIMLNTNTARICCQCLCVIKLIPWSLKTD